MATKTLGVKRITATLTLENETDLVITVGADGYLKQELNRAPGTNDYYAEVAASNDMVLQLRGLLEAVDA